MAGPSKMLLGLEPFRGATEYGLGWLLNMPLKTICKAGDSHPIIVFPGLGTADGSTHYIRTFLNDIGYKAYPWNLGRNLGPRKGMADMMSRLEARLLEVYEDSGQQEISLIGWSLGGIYARELAKLHPEMVRQVITLGTPFKASAGGTNAEGLYEILSGDTSHRNPDVIAQIAIPPEVPFTSLYSKSDGVVHWECSIEDTGPLWENIEVPAASHLGLGHNPIAMYLIADRLTKCKENWTLFTTK